MESKHLDTLKDALPLEHVFHQRLRLRAMKRTPMSRFFALLRMTGGELFLMLLIVKSLYFRLLENLSTSATLTAC